MWRILPLLMFLILSLSACLPGEFQPDLAGAPQVTTTTAATTPLPTAVPSVQIDPLTNPTPPTVPPATPGPSPTPTPLPPGAVAPTATFWPTVTRQVLPAEIAAGLPACQNRVVSDDLLEIATQQFTLPDDFAPSDLITLSDHFPNDVTLGLGTQIRSVILEPLSRLIEAMHSAELHPSILSGYRSYNEQQLAWKWWGSQYPDRVAIMSAQAGHSEHQLGTTVDFGSPALNHLFHVDFAGTPEGIWLAGNAHLYGFTLSYPADTYHITGFKYEPWHYRYVGIPLATQLFDSGQLLTEWQLANFPPPCVP